MAVASCHKPTVDCTCRIKPLVEPIEKGAIYTAENVVAYAFYASADEWYVDDYAQAEGGLLTSKSDATAFKASDVMAQQDETGMLVLPALKQNVVMLVVCDRKERIYAWQQYLVVEDLAQVQLKVKFCPWKTEASYKEANWTIVNEFLEEPDPEPDPEPEP